jgi:hypothetical protein
MWLSIQEQWEVSQKFSRAHCFIVPNEEMLLLADSIRKEMNGVTRIVNGRVEQVNRGASGKNNSIVPNSRSKMKR